MKATRPTQPRQPLQKFYALIPNNAELDERVKKHRPTHDDMVWRSGAEFVKWYYGKGERE